MNPKVFMSYSRKEVSFVNQLVNDLENADFNVWLDYRSLIPGTSWAEQIEQGINASEVIVLVVSKASMASEYVEMEWQSVLKQGKRVILAIFEAVDLPDDLECFEWVDFRSNYKAGLAELIRQLQKPEEEDHPAPKTGFKMPAMIWGAITLSIVMAVLSVGAIWTLFIPLILIPLPFRILKRDFNFTQVQLAVILLPFALFMSTFFVESDLLFELVLYLGFISLPFVFAFVFVLRSAGMQRWGKPAATLPRFANPYDPENLVPKPISFFIDYAPEDRATAEDLRSTLEKYGHPKVDNIQQAKAVFVLISEFNKSTQADPQKQVVYPVVLQTTDDIPEKLSKVQWIDFRHGVRNLEAIAQLLPEPAKLLKALGIRPMGEQQILPPIIQYLVYFLLALAIVTVGSWLPYVFQFLPDIFDYSDADMPLLMLLINLVLFVTLSVLMFRAIVNRRGRLASSRNAFLAMLVLGALVLWQFMLNDAILEAYGVFDNDNDFRGLSAYFPPLIYFFGNAIMTFFVFLKRADMRRWFPAKARKGVPVHSQRHPQE